MIAVKGFALGKEFCEKLGFDPSDTKSIDLHIAVDDVITATVVKYVEGDKLENALEVLKKYNLVLEDGEDNG